MPVSFARGIRHKEPEPTDSRVPVYRYVLVPGPAAPDAIREDLAAIGALAGVKVKQQRHNKHRHPVLVDGPPSLAEMQALLSERRRWSASSAILCLGPMD